MLQTLIAPVDDLKAEFSQELQNITNWWCENTLDLANGGFIGEVSHQGKRIEDADKGIILNTRLLWYFSEAANFSDCQKAKKMADRAYHYLMNAFDDNQYGGVIWAVNAQGDVVDDKKQTYAQAFAIYALSSYFQLTQDQKVITKAMQYFELLETKTHDDVLGGYLEAFDCQWHEIDDMRLSEKDDNLPKTMNTHLHILEAYTNLQKVYPNEKVAIALEKLLHYFQEYIVDHNSNHLRLFMGRDWKDYSQVYSYGHDIEASWLLHKSLMVLDKPTLTDQVMPTIIQLAKTCLDEGVGQYNQVLDEVNITTGEVHQESVWWVQAEAIVGFLNAYKLTQEQEFYDAAVNIWQFVKIFHIDANHGEWHWLSTFDQNESYNLHKVCFWKGPYHNGRAMMEAIKLL